MSLDIAELEQQLAALHARERDGLQVFKEAMERAQRVGLCRPRPQAPEFGSPPFPIPTKLSAQRRTQAPARAKTPRPAEHPVHGGNRGRSELRDQIEAWIDQRDTPFKVNDLPASLLKDIGKAAKCLGNLKSKGVLTSAGRATYQRASASPPSPQRETPPKPDAPIAPKYNLTPNGVPVLDGRLLKERAAQAARYIIGLHKGKSLGALALIEECRGVFPHLVENENRIQDFRVALIDAAQAGLLTRIGKGPDAVYCDPVTQS